MSCVVPAEDVFSSLAVPLMKLVGLKSAEMAEQGRSSTIFMKISSQSQDKCEDMNSVNTHKSLSSAEREYEIHKLEEDYTNSAIMAGKELIQKQKLQLIQLIQLLKQVENCVNSSQKTMFQTIDDHRDCIHTFVKKAFTYVCITQQSSHDGSAFTIILKLLKAIYHQLLAPQEDQTKDDKLLWELLKKKRTWQQPESPFGPEELLPVRTSTKHQKPTRGKPSTITRRPTTQSYAKTRLQSLDSLLPLGSSPSVTTKHVLARKHVAR
ncbi:hypothetical protein L6452_39777 [Arctium lappa]|uniref:Uncharacterized protein n=1 Tax=Arctium lappa TaxID=4217 RepID=A0ACB8XXD1_ARCLA|nr:hypothetical protein L6452_39777 [Arctium lappa]